MAPAIMSGSKPANNQTPIALSNPVSWRLEIIIHCKIHPIHGIHPTSAITKAVTKTDPKFVFLASSNFSAIYRNIVINIKAIRITTTTMSIITPIPKPTNQFHKGPTGSIFLFTKILFIFFNQFRLNINFETPNKKIVTYSFFKNNSSFLFFNSSRNVKINKLTDSKQFIWRE